MSHHIVHILNHRSRLSKQRGMMVCRNEDPDEVHELPIEDVRAVIIAAHGVIMSPELISALMENNAVILHCDCSYKPVGITTGIERVIKSGALVNQAKQSLKLHERIWRRIVNAKIANQMRVLESYDVQAPFLKRELEQGMADEASCARHYWRKYFSILGAYSIKRRSDDYEGFNARLNYGYAVLGALIHRSIVAHGLSPVFGIHHITRYKAHALVYDLMEPWRPYVDFMLAEFVKDNPGENDMKVWARYVANGLKDIKVKTPKQKLKLLDAIDVYVSGIAKCYAEKTVRHTWMPEL